MQWYFAVALVILAYTYYSHVVPVAQMQTQALVPSIAGLSRLLATHQSVHKVLIIVLILRVDV